MSWGLCLNDLSKLNTLNSADVLKIASSFRFQDPYAYACALALPQSGFRTKQQWPMNLQPDRTAATSNQSASGTSNCYRGEARLEQAGRRSVPSEGCRYLPARAPSRNCEHGRYLGTCQFGDKEEDDELCYYDRKPAAICCHYPSSADLPRDMPPLMIESDTSSYANSRGDDQWSCSYDGRCYEDEHLHDHAEAISSARASYSCHDGVVASVCNKDYWGNSCNSSNRSSINSAEIEVSPGVYSRLRGAAETWRAVENDFYMPSECSCCSLTIFGIQDADFILCPECRVVSPMAGKLYEGSNGGVGLGFTMESLAKWQDDIEQQQAFTRQCQL